ncbi:hypothetical protein [Bradyrhizobium symbiodeficiens]|uniref:Uncharacterized protein n=1 Tax=Bradyrhizobium symbiodeficiens TaxID=1404367 RepID=A0A6G9A058_9BRAD|nr:hypothetical protein [Bradyrhizobium symbiodeficiens]QIP05831.1 hypothetical protein HAV00_06060 [Bradyrhizobium symbiodeficiens]
MSQNFDNRKRAFADVVTIDVWHQSFDEETASADLHADVVFGTARVGGETDSPIRFRLSVKRAEIVVVIPEAEPVTVDRRSVSRDAPELQGRLTQVVERTSQANAKGSVAGGLSAIGLTGSASVEGNAQTSMSASNRIEVSETIQFMLVTQSKTADGHYRWSAEPRTTKVLRGRPWDGAKEPRLRLIDRRKDRSKGIPPTVRVEVRCRREDLVIEDLVVKDENLWEKIQGRAGFRNRMAAAESYIRDQLSQEGLEVRNIQDSFGQLTLADVAADST